MSAIVRSLLGAPGFSAVVVLTLALGLGSNTALFSIADHLLFRSLPYRDPGRLVVISETQPASRARALVSAPDFLAWKNASRTIARMAAFRPWGFVLTGSGEAERLTGARVSADLFPLLGALPILGRTFLPSEDAYGASHVAIVSERLWRQRLGSASDLSTRSITLNGDPHLVVGVMPREFRLPDVDVWVPLALEPFALAQHGTRPLTVIGRLADNATLAHARTEMDAIAADVARRFPDASAGWGAEVISLDDHLVGRMRPTLILLWGAVALVLLAACANTAGLLFARAGARRQEIAVRTALGAGRARLVRRLLGESVTLAIVAGITGIPLASGLLAVLVSLAPPDLTSLSGAAIDLRVAVFSIVLSIVTGIVFGLVPALRATGDDLSPLLRGGRSGGAASPAVFRNAAVACQMAIALIVVICAGLLVRSFDRLLAVHPGVDPHRVLTMTVAPGPRYADPARRAAFFAQLLHDIEAIPGVVSAGLVSHPPLASLVLTVDFSVEGATTSQRAMPSASYSAVGGKWFETMGISLLRGRGFTPRDTEGTPAVVVISANLAKLLWPAGDAVGHRLIVGGTIGADSSPREIVGVASDVRASLESAPPLQIYVPYPQNPWPSMSVAVRTSGDPAQWTGPVRAAVSALDPDQAVYNIRTFDQIVSRAVATRRFQALIVSLFAVVALALCLSGVYGVVTYTVRLRTREIGVRMALGAPRGSLIRLAVRDSMVSATAGIVAGLLIASALTRALARMLYEIPPTDTVTFAAAVACAAAIAALGATIAARRATSIDPLTALRVE